MSDPRGVLTRPAPGPDETFTYGPHADNVVDVRRARGAARGRVVVLHGGFWRPEYNRAHLGPMATALAEEGYDTLTPEYRRTGWPEIFDDVAALTDAIEGPYVLAGHSAGGHLAMWAAARHRLPASGVARAWRRAGPLPLAGVLALAPVGDLVRAHDLDLDAGAVRDLLGGSPDERPERYAAADPKSLGSDALVIHGTEDDRVPTGLSRGLSGITLRELPGVEHFGLIDPLSPAWPAVLGALSSISGSTD